MKSSPRKPEAKTATHTEAKDDTEARDALESLPMTDVLAKLESSADGLTTAEAKMRLAQYGATEIEEKKANPLLKFLTYLWGPIPWMIEAAVVLSALAQHWPDFAIILVLLMANAVVGFWAEHQAGNAIAALKAKLAVEARVKRDGKWVTAPRTGPRPETCAWSWGSRPCWASSGWSPPSACSTWASESSTSIATTFRRSGT